MRAVLEDICAPFEAYLRYTWGPDSRWVTIYYQWRDLHFCVLDSGFAVESVHRFIERCRQRDNLVNLPESPGLEISGLPVGKGEQFGFYAMSHSRLYESFRSLLPQRNLFLLLFKVVADCDETYA